MKKPRPKKCKSCGETFQPEKQLQPCCSVTCAIALAKKQRTNEQKRVKTERRKKYAANDISKQKKLTQAIFNKFTRLRDGNYCLACGRTITGQVHASHYRSVGACPALRFNEDNVHSGCVSCNLFNSGNILEFRLGLIRKIGIERVEFLEQDHPPKKYLISELVAIRKKYSKLCKEMN